jgi:hypothetical protein
MTALAFGPRATRGEEAKTYYFYCTVHGQMPAKGMRWAEVFSNVVSATWTNPYMAPGTVLEDAQNQFESYALAKVGRKYISLPSNGGKFFKTRAEAAAARNQALGRAVRDGSEVREIDDFDFAFESSPRGGAPSAPHLLSQGKPARASAEEPGNFAARGNDGDERTRWCAPDGTHGHWFQIDLERTYQLSKATILWEFAGTYRYRIEVSEDGVAWSLAVDRSDSAGRAQQTEDLLDTRGRYVRLKIVGATKYEQGFPEDTWDSFYEFRIWGTEGT